MGPGLGSPEFNGFGIGYHAIHQFQWGRALGARNSTEPNVNAHKGK